MIRWMIATIEGEESDCLIANKTVNHFLHILRKDSRAANRKKARDRWIHRQVYLERL